MKPLLTQSLEYVWKFAHKTVTRKTLQIDVYKHVNNNLLGLRMIQPGNAWILALTVILQIIVQ